ncbi:MAG: pentapeptide repeat-containing protein, partial [Microcoleaceae cyanobacterium]
FSLANLQQANLRGANLTYADLTGANLQETIYDDDREQE